MSVKNLYDEYGTRPDIKIHIPDKLHKGKSMEKEYFFNIVNTLFPEELQTIVAHANS